MGPFRPTSSGSLEHNPYAWTNIANMVFIEQPVGVGFSYSSEPNFYDSAQYGDKQSATDNLLILQEFYKKFPERSYNDMYIAAESYGGHYIPQLALQILNNDNVMLSRLKGLLIGNPFVNFGTFIAIADVFWGHQMIPYPLWKQFKQNKCDVLTFTNINIYSEKCNDLLTQIYEAPGKLIDQCKYLE
jgi:serine carboxypeptidase-like clade 2